MTGLVRPKVTDTWELVVVCDRCGDSERAEGLEIRDFGIHVPGAAEAAPEDA